MKRFLLRLTFFVAVIPFVFSLPFYWLFTGKSVSDLMERFDRWTEGE